MRVTLEEWLGGKAAVIRRGPLVYSLKIAEKRVESMHEPDAIRQVLRANEVQGFPAVEFFPQSEWRYGMESAIKTNPDKIEVKESPMPENPFLAESVPVQLSMPLRQLKQWAADDRSASCRSQAVSEKSGRSSRRSRGAIARRCGDDDPGSLWLDLFTTSSPCTCPVIRAKV